MGKDKGFPWAWFMIFVVFGLVCFISGGLVANIIHKKQFSAAQVQLSKKLELESAETSVISADGNIAAPPAVPEKVIEQRPGFDQRIQEISGDMTYRQVESFAGVPRDKTKDSQAREVWIYPSEKSGYRNVVYFSSGKVVQSGSLPLNSVLD
ncbi:MAG: hypothetical protein WCY10_00285 [Candidatus Omnitrophota bacterium]